MFVLGFVVRFIGVSENLFCPIMKKKYIYILLGAGFSVLSSSIFAYLC